MTQDLGTPNLRDPDLRDPNLRDPNLRDRAVRAARGLAPFDRLFAGGTVIDVMTGELRPADIGLVGPLIASVHRRGARDDAHATHDARGCFLAPGLIDTHLHIESSMVTPRRYAETVLPQGTTTICWDPHELGNVLGLDGVRWAIEAARELPLRVLVLAPSCVPSAPGLERGGAVFNAPEMQTMLAWPEVAGVAEIMDMRGVLERSEKMSGIIGAGLASGKLVCGHARGLSGADLQGFAAAGIQSDHEIISGDDLLEKLRAGFAIELRGSHPYILEGAVRALLSLPLIPQSLTLCTDDVFPDDLVAEGGMLALLRRMIGHGMPPVQALRAATLNAATRIGRHDLGLLAPGRRADLLLLSDLDRMDIRDVFVSGRQVARDGALCVDIGPGQTALPAPTMHVPPLSPEQFRLTVRGNATRVRVRTVDKPRFTEWGETEMEVRDGAVVLPADATLMAVIHRHGHAPAEPVLGVLRGWGSWRGALATSVLHDSHNLAVFGHDPEAMALAANAVIAAEGGIAVAMDGAVRALVALPVCGLLSDAPTATVAAQFQALRAAAEPLTDWSPPYLVLKAVFGASLACNPGPHVTDLGIADGATGAVFAAALMPDAMSESPA
jgi:adenine deaminase